MGQFESISEPKTFRELARMPERIKGDEIKLGDCFFFDPYIQAKEIREAQEAYALRTAMREVELETWPEAVAVELPEVA